MFSYITCEDGSIYVKLDTQAIVLVLENANDKVADIPRGLAQCAGCHQLQEKDGARYAGPSLIGVIGRKVASVDGFDYSNALLGVRGNWDEARVAEFLLNVQSVAPGSTMPQLDLGPTDIRFVVEALQGLQHNQ